MSKSGLGKFPAIHMNSFFRPFQSIDYLYWDFFVVLLLQYITTIVVFIPGLQGSVLRFSLAIVTVMLLPGYAITGTIFPHKSDICGLERLLLTFSTSIITVAFIGFMLDLTGLGIVLEPIIIAITIFTTICLVIAYKRRYDLPKEERFSMEPGKLYADMKAYLVPDNPTRVDKVITVTLLLSITVFVITIGYILIAPPYQEKFTEFYILGEQGKTHEYPGDFLIGYSRPVTVGIVNHEHREVPYRLLLSIDNGQDNPPFYEEKITLGHNQTWEKPIDVAPNVAGNDVKVLFDLYMDDDLSAPYRETYLWVNVSGTGKKDTVFVVRGYNNTTLENYSLKWNNANKKAYNVLVSNQEYRKVPYRLDIVLTDNNGSSILYTENITLAHNQTYNRLIGMYTDRVGTNMQLAFNLYTDGAYDAPYKRLTAVTTVTKPAVTPTPVPVPDGR